MNVNKIAERLRRCGRGLCGFVVLLFPFGVVWFRRSWVDANQIAFHLPLIAGVWMLFVRRLSAVHFAAVIALTVLVADFGLIDDHLYELLQSARLFPSVFVHDGFVNPQYTKLLLYLAVVPILAVRTLLVKARTPELVFVLLSTVAAPTVTLAIHHEIAGQHLARSRELTLREARSVVRRALDVPRDTQALCAQFELRCLPGVSRNRFLEEIEDPAFRKRITDEVSAKDHSVIELGVLSHGQWRRLVVGFVKREEDRFDVFFEEQQINASQKLAEDSFGRLATLANLVWGWLLILLGVFHQSPYRGIVFRLPRP